jgi:hypothetical protein
MIYMGKVDARVHGAELRGVGIYGRAEKID